MDKVAIIQQLIANGEMQNDDETSLFAKAIEDLIYEGIVSELKAEDIQPLLKVISLSDSEESPDLKDMLSDILEAVIERNGERGYGIFLKTVLEVDKEVIEYILMLQKFLYENQRYHRMTKEFFEDASIVERKQLSKLLQHKDLESYCFTLEDIG